MLSMKYCARAIIQHLNGNAKLFEEYKDKAIEIYEEENNICSIEEMIPGSTKEKLYQIVR